MRIAERTKDRLVITHRPWLFVVGGMVTAAAPLVGAIFAWNTEGPLQRLLIGSIGLAMIWVIWRYMPFYTLTFERASGRVLHQMHRFTGTETHALPLDAVAWAKIEATWQDSSRMERLVLGMKDGPLPMEFGFSGAPRQPVADAINDWLTEPVSSRPAPSP